MHPPSRAIASRAISSHPEPSRAPPQPPRAISSASSDLEWWDAQLMPPQHPYEVAIQPRLVSRDEQTPLGLTQRPRGHGKGRRSLGAARGRDGRTQKYRQQTSTRAVTRTHEHQLQAPVRGDRPLVPHLLHGNPARVARPCLVDGTRSAHALSGTPAVYLL